MGHYVGQKLLLERISEITIKTYGKSNFSEILLVLDKSPLKIQEIGVNNLVVPLIHRREVINI